MVEKIVITGAPASGKTDFLNRLKKDINFAKFTFFDELARKLLDENPNYRNNWGQFHRDIYKYQTERENKLKDKLFITDRGTVDAFAFHPETMADIGTTLKIEYDRYDAVTLFYVIEHVENPIAVLKTVKRILKPGGVVLLRWPHTTPIVKLLRPWAAKLDLYHTPYHLYDFSPTTMAMLLDLSGFTAIETIIGGHTCPAHRPSRWVTRACGRLAQTLLTVSKGCWLLPGVSKTTLGRG